MESSSRVWERQILLGLAREWELACGQLTDGYRARMQKPTFRLADTLRQLGRWSPAMREICLSRRLVENHPWDDVRDVLRHEMAHQLADTVLAADDQPSHGPAFRQACLMLRADPAATASQRPLHERLSKGCREEEHPLRQRVQKLLSLAQSRNPHEAEAAMRKAHELMARHHLTTMAADPARSFVSIFLGQPALRHFKEAYFLANLIQDFYFVQGLWVPAFVVAKGKMGRVLEISGTHANVSQAIYVFGFVTAYVDRRWRDMTAENRLTRYQKSDFAVGVIEGFRHKLAQDQLPDCDPAERALIRQTDPRLSTYLQRRYPHTSHIQRGSGRQDQDVYRRGLAVGEEMILHRGITHRSRNDRRQLPPA